MSWTAVEACAFHEGWWLVTCRHEEARPMPTVEGELTAWMECSGCSTVWPEDASPPRRETFLPFWWMLSDPDLPWSAVA